MTLFIAILFTTFVICGFIIALKAIKDTDIIEKEVYLRDKNINREVN